MRMHRSLVPALAAAFLVGPICAQQPSPQDLYGPLFAAVQIAGIFPDSKTFVDAEPKRAPDAILADYRRSPPTSPETLRTFVLANFTVPGVNDRSPADLRRHIRMLWPSLVRQAEAIPTGSSALLMSGPYVIPGGRFREIYYWDSYFTMLGLTVDGQQPLVEAMIADFTDTIERYGHIPNGMRTYYLGRAQPPFYAAMLDLSRDSDPALASRRLAALKREHGYWMKGAACLDATAACERVVRMPDGTLLNRYWDDRPLPRDESYAEDLATAKADPDRPSGSLYRHLRAGAESGWDFSSRWLADPQRLASIRTTDIVPIDLNSLMFFMETAIARRSAAAGDKVEASRFTKLAEARRRAIDRYLWVSSEGRFADWDRIARKPTSRVSAATLYPLFAGAASAMQAEAVSAMVRKVLLAPGGLRTTTLYTGQQWDAPNGWAPLQWIAVAGLERSGQAGLAYEIARRWISTVAITYSDTGKMLEKYNVEERKTGGGGEYPTQDGFGWTNGVASAILERYPKISIPVYARSQN